jgi:hypothetical protein
MKKIYLIPLIILFFSSFTIAQNPEAGNVRLSILTERIQYPSTGRFTQSFGLQLEWFVSDLISLNYNFDGGFNIDRKFYFHMPLGTWFASYPFSTYANTGQNFWLYASVISLVIPEGINFNIRPSETMMISPYIAPLGVYYERRIENDNRSFEAGFSGGLKFSVSKENLFFAPYAGMRSLYKRGSTWGIVGGVNLGVTF